MGNELYKPQHHARHNRHDGKAAQSVLNGAPCHLPPPPTWISFPMTTPDATDIVAPCWMGMTVRATPRLIGASTVLLPSGPIAVKLTMVPSGSALPLQSRTGSVSTSTPFGVGCALIRRLQASFATSCTTRSTFTLPSEASKCAAPSLRVEFTSVQATPLRLVTERTSGGASFTVSWKVTVCGVSTTL